METYQRNEKTDGISRYDAFENQQITNETNNEMSNTQINQNNIN